MKSNHIPGLAVHIIIRRTVEKPGDVCSKKFLAPRIASALARERLDILLGDSLPLSCMTKIDHSASRLLAQIQIDLLPSLRTTVQTLTQADGLQTSREIQASIALLRNIIPRLETYQGRRERAFWNRVENRGVHMIWTGEGNNGPDGAPRCEWMGRRTTPARVAWMLITGDPLSSGREGERLRRICDQHRCIAPGCHRKAASVSGRTTGVHMDQDGNPTCKSGHPIKRFPRPRETVYCKWCRQESKRPLARRPDLEGPLRVDPGFVPHAYVDATPDGAPLLLSLRVAQQGQSDPSTRAHTPPAQSNDEFFSILDAMFASGKDPGAERPGA